MVGLAEARAGGSAPQPGRYRDGALAVAPLAVGSVAFGISFGLLARTSGLGPAPALAMSAGAFTGTAQFAAVSVIGAGGSLLSAIIAAAFLNVRYVAMGLAAGSSFHGSAARRFARAQFIVDESWAVANRGRRGFDLKVLVGAGLVLWASWLSGTAIGLFGAGALGDPHRFGLDMMAPALFLSLLVPHLRRRRAVLAAGLAVAISASLIPFAAPGIPIVLASVAAFAGWRSP